MQLEDFHVGMMVQIKEGISGLPVDYKAYKGKPLEVTKIEEDQEYPIHVAGVGHPMQFQVHELMPANSLLYKVKQESTKF
jgi:hypothetical protein